MDHKTWLGRRNGWEWAALALPIAIDAGHAAIFERVNAVFVNLLATPSKGAIASVLGVYLVFVLSLWGVGRLVPSVRLKVVELRHRGEDGRIRTSAHTWPQLIFFYPHFGFGIMMLMAIASVSGLMSEDVGISETWQAWVFGIGAVVGVAHLVLVSSPPKARYEPRQAGYFWILATVVLVSAVMMNFATALWMHFLGPGPGAVPLEEASFGASFAIGAPLYLFFFVAPRFTFMSRHFTWSTLASGVVFALYELWLLVQRAPLL